MDARPRLTEDSPLGLRATAADCSDPVTVVLIDDHPNFAQLLAGALNTVPGVLCVGTAAAAAKGVELTVTLQPDIVLVDLQMPGMDGLEATRQIRRAAPAAAVAVLSAHDDESWAAAAARAGASLFLVKGGGLDDVVTAIASLGRRPRLDGAGPARSPRPHLRQPLLAMG